MINAIPALDSDIRQANRALGSVEWWALDDMQSFDGTAHKDAKRAWNRAMRRAAKSILRHEVTR